MKQFKEFVAESLITEQEDHVKLGGQFHDKANNAAHRSFEYHDAMAMHHYHYGKASESDAKVTRKPDLKAKYKRDAADHSSESVRHRAEANRLKNKKD